MGSLAFLTLQFILDTRRPSLGCHGARDLGQDFGRHTISCCPRSQVTERTLRLIGEVLNRRRALRPYHHEHAVLLGSTCVSVGGLAGFEERRDLYLLYHYLNHYNLFGSGYYSECKSIMTRLVQKL
jgi:Fructosamine kinase